MRSRALTAPGWFHIGDCVLRYARQVRLPAPAACASAWQWRSAPSSPPRSPPLPGPVLVTKNDIGPVGGADGGTAQPAMAADRTARAIVVCFGMLTP